MYKYFLILALIIISFLYYSFFYAKYYNGQVSDHFDGTRFFDPELSDNKNFFDFLKWRFTAKSSSWPNKVQNNQLDIPPARVMGSDLRVSYVGHVTFLIQTNGINILTDRVWSDRASPVSFAGPRRVKEPGIKFIDLPPIDVVWISHNHYDHLDLETIDLLWKKHKPRIITPLGNDTIIKKHNIEIEVEAYDWGDKVAINEHINFHIEPMQHWSARGLFDKNKALWGALNIETKSGNIYFIGDSGYGEGRYFKRAKKKFGEFRLALLPMGAYEPRWFMEYAHMDPKDMIKAHIDLGRPFTVPSHYDVFKLTDEPMGDAILNLEKAKKDASIGKMVNLLEVGQYWFVPQKL
jgi:L-ascorbate metabolism protein UlaG (beta-lactamase superfamily)